MTWSLGRFLMLLGLTGLPVQMAYAQNQTQNSNGSPSRASSKDKLTEGAEKGSVRPYKFLWSTRLTGGVIQDDLSNQRSQAGLLMRLGLDYQLTPIFNLQLTPRLRFTNGYVQSATPTNGRENLVELQNAAATLSDQSYYSVSGGILDLESEHSSILVENSFPAARAWLSSGKNSPLSLTASVLTAVPSASSQTNNSSDLEKTPQFQSAGLGLGVNGSTFTGLLKASAFQYRDLPLNISNDSVLLGNTGFTGTNTSQSEFQYEFEGLEARLEMTWQIHRRLKYALKTAGIQNRKAPEKKNQAYMIDNIAELILSRDYALIPRFQFFRSESDATIANYNDSGISTNRVGYRGSLALQYQKLFRFGVGGGERTVLVERPSQERERFIHLTLETLDAAL